jgi:enoyl-CoA hydratase
VVIREDRGAVAVIRLAHGKVHALDAEFCDALVAELARVRGGAARALVITGTGSTFSAGVDLFRITSGGEDYVRAFLPRMDALFREVLTFPRPVVAAINGHAIAGGCVLAAACDHRVMARGNGRIGVPELLVGVPFPALALTIVSDRIARASARSIVYRGETMLAEDALDVGLIDEIGDAESLMSQACAVAESFAEIPPVAFSLTKRALVQPVLDRVAALAEIDDDVSRAWSDPAIHQAVAAYLERTVRRK